MSDSAGQDRASLRRFLVHLGERDVGLSNFVRQLLDAEWEVIECWGPEQMDVWCLRLQRGTRVLRFGIERGFVDEVLVGSADKNTATTYPLSYAVLGWARAHGAVVALDDPDNFRPNVAAHAMAVVDWLAAGNEATVDRIRLAFTAYWSQRYGPDQQLGEEWLAETKVRGIDAIERAARPSQ